jgi:hypothetical protein
MFRQLSIAAVALSLGMFSTGYNIHARTFLLTFTQHLLKSRPSLSNVEPLAMHHSTTLSLDQALEVSQSPTSFQKAVHLYFSSSAARQQLDSGMAKTSLNGWTTLV